jgi:hypothetical protein
MLRDKLLRMKPSLRSLTPKQLLSIIAGLNSLVIIGFAFMSLPASHHRSQNQSLWCCSFVALVIGTIGSMFAEQDLRDGINSGRWPDILLAVPRKLAARPASYVIQGLLFMGGIGAIIACAVFHGFHLGGAWCFLWPMMSFTRIQSYLRTRPTSKPSLWSTEQSKPLQSENWGAPPRPFSS